MASKNYEDKNKSPLMEVVYKTTTTSVLEKNELLQPEKSKSGFLYLTAVSVNLLMFICGSGFTWTSPVSSKLNGFEGLDFNPLGRPVTPTEQSWITSLLGLGAGIGPLIATRIVDNLGRKRALQCFALPLFVAYVTLALAHYTYLFYFARLLLGIGMGGTFTVLPIYLGEISEIKNRGIICCLMGVLLAVGAAFPLAVGPFVSVKVLSYLCTIPTIIFFLSSLTFVPESPQYLTTIGDTEGAEKSLKKLRGLGSRAIQSELKEIMRFEHEQKSGLKVLFGSKGLRKAITITVGVIILQQVSGINALMGYMQSIFDAANSGLSTYLSSNIVGIVQIVATLITSVFVEKLGRKLLFLISSTSCGIAMTSLGFYFHFKHKGFVLDDYSWLPVTSFLLYIIGFNLGLGTLPNALVGELFPTNVKSVASTLTMSIGFTTSFLITLIFPFLNQILGAAYSFWLFGLFCFIGTIFIFVTLIETKGKSFKEIQLLLSGQKHEVPAVSKDITKIISE